jgi:hypothetical protein
MIQMLKCLVLRLYKLLVLFVTDIIDKKVECQSLGTLFKSENVVKACQKSLGFVHTYKPWLKRLDRDKHTGIFVCDVSDKEEERFLNIDTWC